MISLNDLVIGKIVNTSSDLLITELNQTDKLVKILGILVGKQESLFLERQQTVFKEIIKNNNKLSIHDLLNEIVESEDESLEAYKVVSKRILAEKCGVNKLAFLLS